MKCASCDDRECREGKNCTGLDPEYGEEEMKIMKTASEIEAGYYMRKTRLEELILFAKKMKYERLGLAFCVGLADEAALISEILERDFTVFSVCCKVCGISKDEMGFDRIKEEGYEATCNPKMQALLLGKKKTDLNIIVGLCMGHDIVFTANSSAPVTTLIVKDRVLAHNPAGAIYSGYYRRKKFGMEEK
jgi:uncharacterized metal-binding protein